MELRSAAFEDGGTIPVEHATTRVEGGENVSIPYEWSGAPSDTRSYALALVDTHPVANEWVHWLVVDIPPDSLSIERGASGTAMPKGSRELDSTYGSSGYGGPQPPPGTGEHSYVATVYALDVPSIDLSDDPSLSDFESAIDGHVLAEATVSGVFAR
jgi:Raf kinase inhibitor-like YbhB/YbcL family protein